MKQKDRKVYTKKCKHCGKEFETINSLKLYCSEKCRGKEKYKIHRERAQNDNVSVTCAVCGKEFVPKRRNTLYCSQECINVARRKAYKEKNQTLKICPVCGKEFLSKRKNNIYCSYECKTKACHKSYYENNKEKCKADSKAYKALHPKSPKPDEVKICPICGKEFTTKISNKKYCSSKCKDKSYRIMYPERVKEQRKLYRSKNIEKIKKREKEWAEKNRERRNLQKKEYYLTHKEEKKKYAELHKDRIRENSIRLYHKKMKESPTFRMMRICRGFIRRCLENKKSERTQTILGYAPEDLKMYIETLFYGDMSWDNYREWEVHHIKPLTTFNFLNEDGTDNYDAIKEANALSNLMPLFVEDHKTVTSLFLSDNICLTFNEINQLIKGEKQC